MIVSYFHASYFVYALVNNGNIVTYNTYLQLGVDGLRGLQNFNINDGVSAIFERARFIRAILTHDAYRNGGRPTAG
jgi:hypothetical protein